MIFIQRLATQEEINQLVNVLVNDQWEAVLRYPYAGGSEEALMEGKEKYCARYISERRNEAGDFVLVSDFEEYDFSVYVMQLTLKEYDENDCYIIHSQRFMRVGESFMMLDPDQLAFSLADEVKALKASRSKTKAGRPPRPTDQTILMAHQVLDLINRHKFNVTDACKKVEMPRNSYYKAAKWITENIPFYQNTKIK